MAEDDEVIFGEFIDSAFGDYHNEPINIATVHFNGLEAFISTNCPCFPSAKGTLVKGDRLTPETHIGYFAADGEAIPYDQPYARIVIK